MIGRAAVGSTPAPTPSDRRGDSLPRLPHVDGSRSWRRSGKVVAVTQHELGATTMEITIVGLDLAKNAFQVHAIGSTGEVVVRRALRRAQVIPFFSKLPPCLGSIPPAMSALRLGSGPQHGLGSG